MPTIKRVLLIHPPGNRVIKRNGERGLKACVQPLGLAYLAAVLRLQEYEVRILDCIAEGYEAPEVEVEPEIFRYGLSGQAIAQVVDDFRPDMVCIGCPQLVRLPDALDVAEVVKLTAPHVPIVMGGSSVSTIGSQVLKMSKNVDFVVQGEGEERLPALLQALKAKVGLEMVDGLIWRGDRDIVSNPAINTVKNLNDLPMPAYDLLPMELYFKYNRHPSVHGSARRTSMMITSRGCPHTCYYCPVHRVFGPKRPSFRMRSDESVLTEIDFLTKQYGVEEIQFEDANFNASRKRTIALSNAIGERFPGLRWTTPHGNQVSTLTPEVLAAMRRGGCYSLHLAIESGNQDFLDQRKEIVDLGGIRSLLFAAKEQDFFVSSFFMIGFPEETRKEIANTVAYAHTLVEYLDDVHFFISIPFPGTEMHDMCARQGLLAPERSWRHLRYSYGIIKTEHFDPAYLQAVRRDGWLLVRGEIEARRGGVSLVANEVKIYG